MSDDTAARARIMVVDDSALMRKAAQKMLGAEFDVVTAEDGLDAWAKLERDTSIQVVFSDLMMPRCDGYDLLKMVRAAEDTGIQNIPLVVVTGADNDEAARMRALDMGATDFITKPFTTTDLIARARAHAKYQRITRQLQEQSTLDPLTGLLNKGGFLARVQQEIAFARRHGDPLTVVCVEIDDFRDIFLKQGKQIAEGLVSIVAHEIRARIRPEDSASRVGLNAYALSFLAGQHDGIEAMIGRLKNDLAAVAQERGERHVPITLSAAVLTPVLQSETEANDVLEQCQELLKEVQAKAAAAAGKPAKAKAAKAEAKPAVPVEPAPAAPMPVVPASATPAEPAKAKAMPVEAPAVSVDEFLTQVEGGQTQAAIEKIPQVLNRLLPLFRLLRPSQRERLVKFLQQLG